MPSTKRTGPLSVMSIVGARPNFMKVAPIVAQMAVTPDDFTLTLVHTGQHYDDKLSQVFFDELGIPRPDVNLNVGSGSHAQQTAAVMAAFEPVLLQYQPDMVIVVGDVNSTLACALVACKLGVPVAHVESGLRSFDRAMPEEVNRLLTDQIADLLFTSEPEAEPNLLREGIAPERIHFVGNVMIDTLLAHREHARAQRVAQRFGLTPHAYGLLTLHRPSNVDDLATFDGLMEAIGVIGHEVPVIFPVHPRTREAIKRSSRAQQLVEEGAVRIVDPLGYVDFLGLMESSRVVLTDSGGVQEETTILGVPCLTLRENTERPVTVTHGSNRIVGTNPARIIQAWQDLSTAPRAARPAPPLWDGHAAARIADVLRSVRQDAAKSAAAR